MQHELLYMLLNSGISIPLYVFGLVSLFSLLSHTFSTTQHFQESRRNAHSSSPGMFWGERESSLKLGYKGHIV